MMKTGSKTLCFFLNFNMVSQTKNKLDLFQKCRFEKMDFPKFENSSEGT